MTSATDDRIEIVDDRFWLKRAVDLQADSLKKLDEGARTIASAIGWFWTAYSAIAAAALAFIDRQLSWRWALVVAVPAVMLFAAYTIATWAAMPIDMRFNVVAPKEIKDALLETREKKRRRLGWGIALAAASSLFVMISVLALALGERPTRDQVGFVLTRSADGVHIAAGGKMTADVTVAIDVAPAGWASFGRVLTAEKERPFSISIPVPSAASYEVSATWVMNGRTIVMRQDVKP